MKHLLLYAILILPAASETAMTSAQNVKSQVCPAPSDSSGAAELRATADAERFKQITPEVINYTGVLEPDKLYRARVKWGENNTFILVKAPTVPLHHVVSVEWVNTRVFPALTGGQIIFRVVSKETKKFRQNLWVTNYVCEILKVEGGR